MHQNKRTKGYWKKQRERFTDGRKARCRAKQLRSHEHVAHVLVDKEQQEYVVAYSVAKWYLQDLQQAGVKL